MQVYTNQVHNRLVYPFSYTILLGPVAHSVTSGNPLVDAELLKLLGHVLPALVILQSSNSDIKLCLCIGFEPFERIKGLRFGLHGDHHLEATIIIDPSAPIAVARVGTGLGEAHGRQNGRAEVA